MAAGSRAVSRDSFLIRAENVHLDYPVYSVNAQSVRQTVISLAVGGRLMRSSGGVVHVSALKGVNFTVRDGDRLGIVGHNGSGKSTLLKVLAGIYAPTHGTLDVRGQISSMLDLGQGMDYNSTGVDNIKILGHRRGLTSKQINAMLPEIISSSELGAYAQLPLRTYSSGMLARLTFSFATSFSPDILLLDEWLSAGDASFGEKARARMDRVVGGARALVLASHSLGLVQDTCNRLLVLNQGAVTYFGDAAEFFDVPRATAGEHSMGGGIPVEKMATGWYTGEGWGRWASEPQAVLRFKRDPGLKLGGIRLKLRAPTHPSLGAIRGTVRSNINPQDFPICAEHPEIAAEVFIPMKTSEPPDEISIEVDTETMVRPADVDAKLADPRPLGWGICSVEFENASAGADR